MKIIDVINSQPVVQKITSQDMPINTAFKISKVLKELEYVSY